MKSSALTLLPLTEYGNPSGNYDGSSLTFTGDEQKAAGYYSTFGTLQSVAFFTEDFIGTITIQATVDITTDDTSWFTVHTFNGDGSSVNDAELRFWNEVQNITGRFTWMRATVSAFTQGVINKVTVTY